MAHRIGRRSFLAAGAAAAGAAAVGTGGLALPGSAWAKANSTNGPGLNGIATGKPKRGGSLTIGTDSEEQGFSPTLDEWDENGYAYGKTVFDPLVAIAATGKPVPYLAQAVESLNPDYTSWVIKLRPTIHFHTGAVCDAAAIDTNIQAAAKSIVTSIVFSEFITKVTVKSPLELQVDLKTALATFPYYLASQIGYVAAPAMVEAGATGNMHPIGTGPFVYTDWLPNTHFTAVANKQYWRKGYPYLDKITFKPIPTGTARSEALRTGTVDLINTATADAILYFRGNKSWAYVDTTAKTVGEPTVNCIQLNCGKPPFTDHNARLAMAKSYTQAALVLQFGKGLSQAVTSPFVKGSPYYKKTTYPGYDPAGAKAALRAYQHKHGKPLAFTLTYIPTPSVERVAQYLKQRYEAVGMQVTLATVLQNDLIDQAVSGDYEAVTWRQFGSVNPDLNYVFWSAKTVTTTGISLNIARNKDQRIQNALIAGRTAKTAAARDAAYQNLGEYLAQDIPYTWLGTGLYALVANPKVQNFVNPVAPNGTHLIGPTSNVFPTQIWLK